MIYILVTRDMLESIGKMGMHRLLRENNTMRVDLVASYKEKKNFDVVRCGRCMNSYSVPSGVSVTFICQMKSQKKTLDCINGKRDHFDPYPWFEEGWEDDENNG